MTDQTPASLLLISSSDRPASVLSDDGKDYTLHARAEILSVLRALLEQGALITVYFNRGEDFLLTALLAIAPDGNMLVLDTGNDTGMNQRALSSEKLICVTNLDKIKIQFVLQGVAATQFEGRPAFIAATPKTVLRIQRRDFYRFILPALQPLKCRIPQKSFDDAQKLIEASVIDIGCGGVGMVAPHEDAELNPGMLLKNCRIELAEGGLLVVDMCVRGVFEVILRTGARHRRAGCQFLDLSGQQQQLLQRFILNAERERKARESGMV